MRKFRNNPCDFAGRHFDSELEKMRYMVLLDAQRKHVITDLELQKPFQLLPGQQGKYRKENPVVYIADFTYIKNGERVVEDTKSDATRKLPTYIIKRKLMLWVHHISIREVKYEDITDV